MIEKIDEQVSVAMVYAPHKGEPWLDPENQDPHLLHSFLKPYDASKMEAFRVSKEVNTTKINEETLIQPMNSK